jgi:ribose transport system substrate-binding protein
MPLSSLVRTVPAALLILLPAQAEEFHGFDPAVFDGRMLAPEQLEAMVADAQHNTPPRNGVSYVFGFANLQRDMIFGIRVEESIKANVEAAGMEVLVADNRLDGATALSNAQSFVRRQVDYVIEFQTDINFGPVIMQHFDRAQTGVIAIDIPMPGAIFFGADNPRSGFMCGSYLAQAARERFGPQVFETAYLVVGELPQSGVIPAMRTNGQVAGFLAAAPGFAEERIIKIDTKNTLQYSFQQMGNVLGRIPSDAPILITAINDQSVTGMLRAVKQKGRQPYALAVGMGADEQETLIGEENFVASVAYFPERYGNYLIPIALMQLAGRPLPSAFLVQHVFVTPANICKYYPEFPCVDEEALAYEFPAKAFAEHLHSLKANLELAEYRELIPDH